MPEVGTPKWSRRGLDRIQERVRITTADTGLVVPTPSKSDLKKKLADRARSSPALWTDRAKTETMLFSDAHATPSAYSVHIGEAMLEIGVTGGTFGRIKSANIHLQQAHRNHPSSFLVQLSCNPASGPAAEASARALHEAGMNTDVYAANKPVVINTFRAFRGGTETFQDLSIEVPRDMPTGAEHHWAVFEAPRDPANSP